MPHCANLLPLQQEANQRDVLALYVGTLDNDTVERYAFFLASLSLLPWHLGADSGERRRGSMGFIWIVWRWLLQSGRLSGCLRVVGFRLLLLDTDDFSFCSTYRHCGAHCCLLSQCSPDAATFLLRSIEWTTFSVLTYTLRLNRQILFYAFS